MTSGRRESTASWAELLRNLKVNPLPAPRLATGDSHVGIGGALTGVWPKPRERRCWNHKLMRVLDKLRKRLYFATSELLRRIPHADTRRQAEPGRRGFAAWCREHGQG